MTEGAAFGHFTLFHGRPNGRFDIGLVREGVRRPPRRPLVLRPSLRVALRFTLAELLHVALSARGRVGHSEVGLVQSMLLADSHVAIDTADFLELLAFVQ